MVKFQSNFTTSEQSKKLLELGVPADSADCYYKSWNTDNLPRLLFFTDTYSDMLEEYAKEYHNIFMPCWSTGRLIDIYEYCTDEKFQRESSVCNLMADCIRSIQLAIKENRFDLSKLEE